MHNNLAWFQFGIQLFSIFANYQNIFFQPLIKKKKELQNNQQPVIN